MYTQIYYYDSIQVLYTMDGMKTTYQMEWGNSLNFFFLFFILFFILYMVIFNCVA